MERLSVADAAARLGVTPDAVRQRIRRDTIPYEKTEDGRYYVYLTPHDGRREGVHDALANALVDRLKDENEFLRRELERKDTIIMTMAQRIPELEAASEPRGEPVSHSEDRGNGDVPPEQERRERSWWRRLFEG